MMRSDAIVVGSKVPNFTLPSQQGSLVSLYEVLEKGPAMLVFYPGDFTMVCTKQLCNYRDNIASFQQYGIQIVGISANPPESHAEFAKTYDLPFTLLSDPGKALAKGFGCTSLLMLGGISRAVFIVAKSGTLLHRYVEPTVLSRRKAGELLEIIQSLRTKQLL